MFKKKSKDERLSDLVYALKIAVQVLEETGNVIPQAITQTLDEEKERGNDATD